MASTITEFHKNKQKVDVFSRFAPQNDQFWDFFKNWRWETCDVLTTGNDIDKQKKQD